MAAKDRSVYEIFTIRSNDGEKTIDLRGGIVSFSYFENVFSPMITAQVIVVSTGNFYIKFSFKRGNNKWNFKSWKEISVYGTNYR